MIIEMRTYKTKPGKRSQFLEIFRSKSIPAHTEIGMKILGPFLSRGGYTVLQLVIEEVAHDTFAGYMRREVRQPLGMTYSSFGWTPEIQASTATAYDQFGNRLPNFLYTEKAAAGL